MAETIIGERLKKLVKERGMEQQEVAAELGIKTPTFNAYAANTREPPVMRLKQFAEYFGVSVDYLTGYTNVRNWDFQYLSEEMKAFINDPENVRYIELAMDIKEKTVQAKEKAR